MENRAIEPDSARSHTFAILSPAIEELERMLRYYSTVLKGLLGHAEQASIRVLRYGDLNAAPYTAVEDLGS